MTFHHGAPAGHLGPAAVAIGSFDGVHVGHQEILAVLARQGLPVLAVTFEPHPRCVLDPGHCPKALTTLEEKGALLAAAGAGHVLALPFTTELAALQPGEFLDRLAAAFEMRVLACGPDFAFGRKRAGDVGWLEAEAPRRGFELLVVPPVRVDGEELHSSDIRTLLADEGDVEAAARRLGRPYRLVGTVEHGAEVGRAIGFPTANLALPLHKLVPRPGIYAGRVRGDGLQALGAVSIGYRPTFGGDRLGVEVYLLDFAGDLYGRRLEVSLEARLRDEVKYESAQALAEQIEKDVADVRRLLA